MPDFKQQLTDDLANVFFNEAEFAEEITLTPAAQGQSPYNISAIFDREFIDVDPETERPILSTHPVARINENELVNPLQPGDTLTIRSQIFEIKTKEPDGVGTIILELKEKIN